METGYQPHDPVRILHVEDNERDAELIEAILNDSGVSAGVKRVDSREDYLAALRQADYDLIVSDFTLPRFDGNTALQLARENCPDTPFIFVSGTIGEETAVDALLSGATDYLLKGNLSRLGPAVHRALRESNHRLEEKRLHSALLDSETQYRQIVEATEDGIWKTDTQGVTTFVNSRISRMLGYTGIELIGRTPMDFVAPPDRELAERYLVLHIKGKRQVFEIRFACKDGTEIWGQVATTPFMDGDRYEGGLMMVTDITEKKKLEAQFLQSQKMEAIGQLAGGVAHDFNNLLQIILGYTDILQDSPKSAGGWNADLMQIEAAAEKATILTRQLLAFGRRQFFNATNINLNEVIQEMVKMMGRVMGEEYRIDLSLEENLRTVRADSAQVEQILMNLCVNARDAMSNGGQIRIETGIREFDEEFSRRNPWAKCGTFVVLVFSDTGEGMTPEVLERVFEPFFTTKPVGCGTGLGLSTVFGIVKQHDGMIHVDSEPGVGTQFEIYFPTGKSNGDTPDLEYECEGTPGGKETILLVEDDPGVRSFARTVLSSSGYQVIEAGDGEEGMKVFEDLKGQIDLSILDMVMPKMDGRTLRLEMKRIKPEGRILFTSGYSVSHFSDPSCDPFPRMEEEFLPKPYHSIDLLRTVRKVLDRCPESAGKSSKA